MAETCTTSYSSHWTPAPPPPPKVLKLLAGNFGRNILTSSLSDIDVDLFWSTCMVQCIHGNYIQAHMAKRSPSKNKLPYRTKSTIKLKARLYRRAKGLDTLQSWSKYNKCRNNLTSAFRSSKKDFFSNLAKNIHSQRHIKNCHQTIRGFHAPQITHKNHSAENLLYREGKSCILFL